MHMVQSLALGVSRKFSVGTGSRVALVGALVSLTLWPLGEAGAQTSGSWVVNADGVWSNAANWSSNPSIPGGTGSVVSFSTSASPARTATIDTTSRTIGILNFNYTGNLGWSLASSGGASLIFDNGVSNAQITMASSANANNTVSAPISLLGNLDITNSNATRELILSGSASAGSAGLKTIQTTGGTVRLNGPITNGSGTTAVRNISSILYLNGTNSFTGGVTLTGGRIYVGNDSALGTGTFAINGGRLGTVTATPVTLTSSAVSIGNNFEVLSGAGVALDLGLGSGNVTLTAGSQIAVTGTNAHFRIGGNIGESGGARLLAKSGNGVLTLSGSNTYSAGTNLVAGTLNLGNNSALGSGAVSVNVASGSSAVISADSTTARNLANNLTLNGTGTTTFGVDGTRGKLTFGNLTATLSGVTEVRADVSFANMSGTANIVKTGAGALEFTGTRSGSGSITVNAGTLLINGTSSGTPGAVNINAGGTLAGAGTIGGDVTIGGTFGPGNSPGTMVFNDDLTFLGTSVSNFEVTGFTSGLYDLALGGAGSQTVSFDGTLNIFVSGGATGTIKLFDFEIYSGAFDTVNISGLGGGQTASFDDLTGTLSVVPEPSTMALVLGAGALGFAAFRRRLRAFRSGAEE